MQFTTYVSVVNDAYVTYSLVTLNFGWSEIGQSQRVCYGNCVKKYLKQLTIKRPYYENSVKQCI